MPILHLQTAATPRQRALHAATALAAALAGWLAHAATVPVAAPAPATRPAASFADTTMPVVLVAPDGLVTLRVDRQPMAWVLEQVANARRRAGLAPAPVAEPVAAPATVATPAGPAMRTATFSAAPVPAACPESGTPPVDPARVMHSIEHGSEPERFDGLMQARSAGLDVADPLLKRLFESGESERVQVAAFEAYLAQRADRPEALRAALEEARHGAAPPVQRQAGQRLAELAELQRLAALPPPTDP